MSHGACRPVSDSVLGETLDGPADIRRMSATVAYNSMDLLQAAHTWSGIEMAMWDLLGRARGVPAWKLLGYDAAYPKIPYASVLFGSTPQATLERAERTRASARPSSAGRRSATLPATSPISTPREGLGPDGICHRCRADLRRRCRGGGTRLDAMERNRVTFFEEPFHGSAYRAYGALSQRVKTVKTAGGEAAHNRYMAEHLIDFGGVGYIQIDCGRIGGLSPAKEVADYAVARGVTYINHTFTSNLALSASLQPFAGLKDHVIRIPDDVEATRVDMNQSHQAGMPTAR